MFSKKLPFFDKICICSGVGFGISIIFIGIALLYNNSLLGGIGTIGILSFMFVLLFGLFIDTFSTEDETGGKGNANNK